MTNQDLLSFVALRRKESFGQLQRWKSIQSRPMRTRKSARNAYGKATLLQALIIKKGHD